MLQTFSTYSTKRTSPRYKHTFSHHQNLIIPIPEDVTLGVGDGTHTIYKTYLYPSLLCKYKLNVSSPVRKWHDKVKMWFIRFIFLSVSVKDSENWRTHIRSYLSPIYSIYTLFLLFLFTEQGDAIFVQIKVQTKRYYKWQKKQKGE